MKTVSLYDTATGHFTGIVVTGWGAELIANLRRTGGAVIEGRYDHLSQRVNLATGQVEDWQPPAPPDTELLTHWWDADSKRWLARPTLLALKRIERARVIVFIEQLEARQPRALREIALAPDAARKRSALGRLADVDKMIESLRQSIAEIDAAPTEQALAAFPKWEQANPT